MSNKPRFGIIFLLVCMATSITFAQSYFSKVTADSSPPPLTTPKSPAMSPDEFKSVSQQQGQQTQQALTSQVNKSIAAAPFPMPTVTGVPAAAQTQQQAQPAASATTTQTTTQSNPGDSYGGSGSNSNQTDTGNSEQQPAQQPYTGYQAAPSSSGNSGSSKPQGLGIKY